MLALLRITIIYCNLRVFGIHVVSFGIVELHCSYCASFLLEFLGIPMEFLPVANGIPALLRITIIYCDLHVLGIHVVSVGIPELHFSYASDM